jgi:hypothetical protein
MRSSTRRSIFAVSALAAVLAPAGAFGQGGVVSSITGYVLDQNGSPLAGVQVTTSSPTQIGGVKRTYSAADGSFTFPGLQPGVFELACTAPKMRKVIIHDIGVSVNAPGEATCVMEVENQKVEEVVVKEKAPLVSTKTSNVKESYDEEFVDQLPVEWRTAVEDFIGKSTAGVVNSGVRSARIRGGGTEQNAFLLEGFYVNNQKVTMKSLAAMEVQTAGYGAEYANTPGGVVNMVTKSGSNKFEIDVNGFHQDSLLRFFRDESDNQARSWFSLINPGFGGPIIKDRLWYYVNLEGRSEIYGTEKDPDSTLGEPIRRSVVNVRLATKLTWQVSPRNKLQTYTNYNWNQYKNNRNVNQYEKDAQEMRDLRDYFASATWEALLTDRTLFKSGVAVQQFWHEDQPENCRTLAVDCDHIVPIRQIYPREVFYQNYNLHDQRLTNTIEFVNSLEWFGTTRRFGEHDVKLVSRVRNNSYEQAQSTPGDQYLTFNGSVPDRLQYFYANDPRLDTARAGWWIRGSSGTITITSLTDTYRPTRFLTLTPGVGMTTIKAAAFGKEDLDIDSLALTPHLAASWDATHDGRTVLRASYNHYVDGDAIRIARHGNGGRVSQTCRWNEPTQEFTRDCTYSGGASGRTFGLPCGPTGVDERGRDCRERLKIPRTYEFTVGAEREVVQGVAVGADVVSRKYTNPYETAETNRIWNGSGTALEPTGGFRSGRSETISDLETPEDAVRDYLGVTGTVRKREGKLKLSSAYTWSHLQGNVFNNEGNEFGENPGKNVYLYGDLPDDARHVVKTSATYTWTTWLSTGLSYTYESGRPYRRRFRNDVTGGFEDYRARVGVNPGGNINDPGDDRPLRLPDRQRVNLQTRVNFKPLLGFNAELYADVINIFALRTATSVEENDGPAFGLSRGRMDPLWVRLGYRFKY